MIKAIGIIPSRYESSRFPGKPLVDIGGKTMIRRVYEQAGKCAALSEVIVATDDERIYNEVESFGGKVMMTSLLHKNGTERCAEVLQQIFLDEKCIVVNIQGDEPFIEPKQIEILVQAFDDENVQIATLIRAFYSEQEKANPSRVKAFVNNNFDALMFSRKPLSNLVKESYQLYKHIGLYAFRSDILKQVVKLSPTDLEVEESLEQLRWLQNGYQIKCVLTTGETISIDTPDDLKQALSML
ncbi:MAG: 3-deoxy-manno-octulosonate cytidylyltransferase [Chitinophagales bacterium]|nr:3-deoxy-manno-octulosonate cytidylyltransferase [Chitinophagales bacterium]